MLINKHSKNVNILLPKINKSESVEIKSEDSINVQAWLTYPSVSKSPKGYPTIFLINGGPGCNYSNSYDPDTLAFANQGYCVIRPNYRGSSGFGQKFLTSIYGRIGELELMDIRAFARYFIEFGVIDPNKLYICGGSYGGYLTLYCMVKEPDLFKAGFSYVGIADWILNYEDSATDIRSYDEGLFGCTPKENPEKYKHASPITFIDQMKNPILIIHGKNDTRCPKRQMDVFVEKLKAKKIKHKYFLFDEGHGSLNIDKNIQFKEMWFDFLNNEKVK